ncbi:MAG TPA: S8 family peptidase [Thermoanaerobaculia bacterium]|nr:S8 family peptidase [Thermoanaerobaculia bacterium]
MPRIASLRRLVQGCLFVLVLLPAAARAQEYVPGQVLVRFGDGLGLLQKLALHRLCGGQPLDVIRGLTGSSPLEIDVVGVIPGLETVALACYNVLPDVVYAELDYVAAGDSTPNDPYFASNQYGPKKIKADQAWDLSTGDANVLVAVLDTGADFNHPDLQGKLVLGWDYVNKDSDPSDDNGHGTHVAGVIGAATNNAQGIAALAWNVRILVVKVLDKGNRGAYSDIAQGIIYAADQGAKILNISLGGTSDSATLRDAVNYAWNKGALLVAAAGNGGSDAPYYPAAYAPVMAVAATDANDGRWSLSNYASYMSVAAPGDAIYSTNWSSGVSGYSSRSGTSQATPHVSGTAALALAQDRSRTNAQLRSLLETTADDLGTAGRDAYFGYGRINAYRALGGAPPATGAHHVGDLDAATSPGQKNWKTTVTVAVHKSDHASASGAAVNGSWSGGLSGTASCTTDAAGRCSIASGNIANSKTSVTFTVTSAALAGSTYSATANHDPESDSNGSRIIVNRP